MRHSILHFFVVLVASIKELRAIEKHNLPNKKILEHGYSRLDNLIMTNSKSKTYDKRKKDLKFKKVLIAPSWGTSCIIESDLCIRLIDDLLLTDYEVILGPHPETVKLSENKIEEILKIYNKNTKFELDRDVSCLDSFSKSDLMI